VELLETQNQRVGERRADLVARASDKDTGQSKILHIEIQNHNDANMPLRMMRYYTDIGFTYAGESIHQYLIYIGKIVELQKVKQNYFKDRSVYYSTFPIQEYLTTALELYDKH